MHLRFPRFEATRMGLTMGKINATLALFFPMPFALRGFLIGSRLFLRNNWELFWQASTIPLNRKGSTSQGAEGAHDTEHSAPTLSRFSRHY
jgi:hypothetical protein